MAQCREIDSFKRFIFSAIDNLVATLDGLSEAQINWHPPAPNANSLVGLATHTMANAAENILQTVCAIDVIPRSSTAEFGAAAASDAPVREQWAALKVRLAAALDALPPTELDRVREHPRRGPLTGREVLLVVARHTAEHMGQAELTRDLAKALAANL